MKRLVIEPDTILKNPGHAGSKKEYLGLVRGYTWKARMSNDRIFLFWTPTKLTRRQAIEQMCYETGWVNTDNTESHVVYGTADIERIWETKGKGGNQ